MENTLSLQDEYGRLNDEDKDFLDKFFYLFNKLPDEKRNEVVEEIRDMAESNARGLHAMS